MAPRYLHTVVVVFAWLFTLFLLLAFATDVLLLYSRQSACSFICSFAKAVAQEVVRPSSVVASSCCAVSSC